MTTLLEVQSHYEPPAEHGESAVSGLIPSEWLKRDGAGEAVGPEGKRLILDGELQETEAGQQRCEWPGRGFHILLIHTPRYKQ